MRYLLATIVLLAGVACHPGQPVVGGDKLQVGGTISGIVSASGASPALASRKVTATNTATNSTYEATTAANGGYTIQVPEGTYRLEVELRAGEIVVKQPPETRIDKSDLDPQLHFTIR